MRRQTWRKSLVLLAVAGAAGVPVAVGIAAGSDEDNGVTATFAREPDSNGYYTSPVQVDFHGLLPEDVCDPPTKLYEGGQVSSTCTPAEGAPYTGSFSRPYDDQKPSLTVPAAPVTVEATSPSGAVVTFEVSADDNSGEPSVSCSPKESGETFPLGTTQVTCTATDVAGLFAEAGFDVVVVDTNAPPAVRGVVAEERSRLVVLRWRNPGSVDFHRVRVHRNRAAAATVGPAVYTGRREVFKDRGVRNGVRYRYVIYALDEAGNHGLGVTRLAMPHRILLTRPKDGATVLRSRPPTLEWVKRARARYYNVQLYRVANGKARKVLSRWPKRARYELSRTWRYDGRRQKLGSGRYVWYVWPGYGPRVNANYGKVMGPSAFRVVKRR